MNTENQTKILYNSVTMPNIGLGTYDISDYNEMKRAIFTALNSNYRHIDTAEHYNNEHLIGRALQEYGINEDEIFITSKVWNQNHGYDETIKAFNKSLERLNLDHIDLYLIHWPEGGKIKETWKALEELYKVGLVRAIGVSNFTIDQLKEILSFCTFKPMVNQVEYHPGLVQNELIEFCNEQEIAIEAYSPLAQGKILDSIVINRIAKAYHKSPAQIVLRWLIQQGLVAIPKSSNPSRIRENNDIYDFRLALEDMDDITNLNTTLRVYPNPHEIEMTL